MQNMGTKAVVRDRKGTLLRLWKYLETQKASILLSFLLVLGTSLVGLSTPYLTGRGVDLINQGQGKVDFAALLRIALLMLLAYAANALFAWLQANVMLRVSQRTVRVMRAGLFSHFQKLPLSYFDGRPHGELMSRMTNDIDNVSSTLGNSLTSFFTSLITITGAIIMMISLSPALSMVSLAILPLSLMVTRTIIRYTRKYYSSQQKALGELNGIIEETISGQKVVKAFCREREMMQTFEAVNRQLQRVGARAQIYSGMLMPLMSVIGNIGFALIAGIGGTLAVRGLLTVGVITSFIGYSRQFTRPINEIANQFNLIQSALAGAERVFEVLDLPPEPQDLPEAAGMETTRGDVCFQHVSFGYRKDLRVLKDVSLEAPAGCTLALVGPTGAGKTTIVNLLTRFYDVDEGEICIDGRDLRRIRRSALRASLGIVLQDTWLFSASIRENIRYGRLDATDSEVEEAARLANADHFIRALQDGYDTVLTEDASNLSQGQRQLISIARAVLANPSILILDEATSNIDTRTEMRIQEVMRKMMQGRTSFVIAHRLSTIRDADRILVINHGRIIEQGTHPTLMAAGGFYRDLYMSQFAAAFVEDV
ncbi:MAG TPA: multidrug ABC transporter ATP-binding protein [Clostridiales bacterium]|nr:multidrug ABC transporter ATP-binding protein [Clostridiales bacterium]